MKLVKRDGNYIAESTFEEREVPKAAGFRWSPDRRCWWTADKSRAAKLVRYADDTLRAELEGIEAERQATIAASAATDADMAIPCPEGLSYLPFQRAGIAFAASHEATLIADEMGLGKTVQAAGLINADSTIQNVLVVCPASLRLNWQRELNRWLVIPREIAIATSAGLPTAQIVIVNYDILHSLRPAIDERSWDLVVCDEAHYLKSGTARRAVAVLGQRKKGSKDEWETTPIEARRRVFLTGTPLVNRPIEAWPLLNFLTPGTFGSRFGYGKRYCGAYRNGHGWDFTGASNLGELQERMRETVMVRRLKADVLTELPPKQRQVIALPANGAGPWVQAENAAFDAHEDRLVDLRAAVEVARASDDPEAYRLAVSELTEASRSAFEGISRARHQTAMAKVPYVVAHVSDAIEDGHKVVVMAHHHDVIDGIADAIPGSVRLTGRDPMTARQEAVDRFQNDPECRVFVGSIQAAGVGLTLTAAAHVVFAELDWVPGNMSQAEDRCHRIGQHDPVLVQHIVFDESLDARMAHALVAKQRVLDKALDDPEAMKAAQLPLLPIGEPAHEEKATREVEHVSDEEKTDILTGLRHLARLDEDCARDLNGVGFNKFDARIGHRLASLDILTDRQALLGRRLCVKYRGQLARLEVAS